MTTYKQGSLFDLQEIVSVDGKGLTIDGAFKLFHEANPHVYKSLRHLALEMRASGRTRYGVAGLFERLRWEYALQTTGDFKLNNNYRALYARKLMAEEPGLAGFFQIRTRTAKGAEQDPAPQPTLTVTALALGGKETAKATVYLSNSDEVTEAKGRALVKVHREWRKIHGNSADHWPSHIEFWLGDLAGGMDYIGGLETEGHDHRGWQQWHAMNTVMPPVGANT